MWPFPQTLLDGTFNDPPEGYDMRRSILIACLILLFLLIAAGVPVAASPVATDMRPVSAPNNGEVTITITGSGFTSQSSAWMTPSSVCDPSQKISGTDCSWSSTSGTCTFWIQGQIPGLYTVWINSPIGDLSDMATLSTRFQIYQGSGTAYTIPPRPATTTYYGSPGPYGTIYVETSPSGAVISLDGEVRGRAPVTITGLWPGSYTITAELAGYQKYKSETTLSGPTRTSVYCRLEPDDSGKGLYVVSTPEPAKIYLDGILKGETPLLLSDAASGSHTLQVKRSGYNEWKSTVWFPESGTKTIAAVLNQNTDEFPQGINVTSNPAGAEVLLDGLKKGNTPITLNNIAAGIHIVEIGYPGYTSWKSTVDVPESVFKVISINLTPKPERLPGSITVRSDPGNALVTLDGNYAGQTPANSSLHLDTLPPGEYTLGLALPGYKPYSTNATVSPNQTSYVNVTLIPVSGPLAKGALSVISDPAGATISIDNTSLGLSPLKVNDIAVGNHRVTVTMEGYEDYSTSVLVTAGTTSTVSATLLAVPSTLQSHGFPWITVLGAFGIIGLFSLRKHE